MAIETNGYQVVNSQPRKGAREMDSRSAHPLVDNIYCRKY